MGTPAKARTAAVTPDSTKALYVPEKRLHWGLTAFLTLTPIAAIAALIVYIASQGFRLTDLIPFAVLYVCTGFSITAGYHRYYAHRSFECHPWVQWFFLLFGAAAVQNSVLNWSTEHRYHHRYADRDGDPYNIKRGFLWAHIGWILFRYEPETLPERARDFERDPRVMFQHRYYVPLIILFGFALPTLIGAAFGRPLAGFLWGGLFRMVLVHHFTFLINSAAHTFGKKTYAPDSTARDSFWLALISFGEGYHSFHHAYPSDFRNGIAWYHWDPSKWLIRALSAVGLAWNLRRSWGWEASSSPRIRSWARS